MLPETLPCLQNKSIFPQLAGCDSLIHTYLGFCQLGNTVLRHVRSFSHFLFLTTFLSAISGQDAANTALLLAVSQHGQQTSSKRERPFLTRLSDCCLKHGRTLCPKQVQ